ncbi:MAG: dockerin type I repeat-containing protein [Planctomycetales bacterium]|nr:dockerin type I repeat-containing protein [Planctomycetales bacterium]
MFNFQSLIPSRRHRSGVPPRSRQLIGLESLETRSMLDAGAMASFLAEIEHAPTEIIAQTMCGELGWGCETLPSPEPYFSPALDARLGSDIHADNWTNATALPNREGMTSVRSNIDHAEDIDSFQIQAKTDYALVSVLPNQNAVSPFQWHVVNSEGKSLVPLADVGYVKLFDIADNGVFHVQVSGNVGQYQLHAFDVANVFEPLPPFQPQFDSEPGDDIHPDELDSESTVRIQNATLISSYLDDIGDVDVFQVNASVDGLLFADMYGLEDDLQLVWSVLRSDGTLVAAAEAPMQPLHAELDGPNTYYIAIQGTGVGAYQLFADFHPHFPSVSEGGPDSTQGADVHPDDIEPHVQTILMEGQTGVVHSFIDFEDDVDVHRYQANTDGDAFASVFSPDGDTEFEVSVKDEDGNDVSPNEDGSFPVESDGIYYIFVTALDGQFGEYVVSVSEIESDMAVPNGGVPPLGPEVDISLAEPTELSVGQTATFTGQVPSNQWSYQAVIASSPGTLQARLTSSNTVGNRRSIAGDVTGDGVFNSSDLVRVFQAGHYEDAIIGNSTWDQGDWNGDGEFNSSDLVLVFQAGLYSAEETELDEFDSTTDGNPAFEPVAWFLSAWDSAGGIIESIDVASGEWVVVPGITIQPNAPILLGVSSNAATAQDFQLELQLIEADAQPPQVTDAEDHPPTENPNRRADEIDQLFAQLGKPIEHWSNEM